MDEELARLLACYPDEMPEALPSFHVLVDRNDVGDMLVRSHGESFALEDLPEPLHERLKALPHVMAERNARRLEFNEFTNVWLTPAGQRPPPGTAERSDSHALTTLFGEASAAIHTAIRDVDWYLRYRSARDNLRPESARPKARLFWQCPDCHAAVAAKREWCTNHTCPSWKQLEEIAGIVILREVQPDATKER